MRSYWKINSSAAIVLSIIFLMYFQDKISRNVLPASAPSMSPIQARTITALNGPTPLPTTVLKVASLLNQEVHDIKAMKYDLTRAKKIPESELYDQMTYEHAEPKYKFIDKYSIFREKGGLSESEAKSFRSLLQDKKNLIVISSHYQGRIPTTFDFNEENSRLKMINFIADAVRLGENAAVTELYDAIDSIMGLDLASITDLRLKKSLAADRIELISVLKDRNPDYLSTYKTNSALTNLDKKLIERGMNHSPLDL